MSLQLVTPPAAEPVALADVKAQLKIDFADDDGLLTSLITAARIRAEWYTRRAFLTQSWTQWHDCWPNGPFEVALPPLLSVSAVTAYDRYDNATVMDPSLYRIDLREGPARIAFKEFVVPLFNLRNMNTLSVAFTCGYGDAGSAVPEPIRRAILMIAADLYAHRGDDAPTPAAALALLQPFRILKV